MLSGTVKRVVRKWWVKDQESWLFCALNGKFHHRKWILKCMCHRVGSKNNLENFGAVVIWVTTKKKKKAR